MRVLHFCKTYFPDSVGGIEQVIRQMCVGTGRLGVTNQVLALSRESDSTVLVTPRRPVPTHIWRMTCSTPPTVSG